MHDHDHDPMNTHEPDLSQKVATDEVLNPKSATLFAAVLGVLCIFCILISVVFMRCWGPEDSPGMVSQDMLPQRPDAMPAPPLQAEPGKEMKTFADHQASMMSGYGWVNKEKGIVRIPIENAIEKTAAKGLPAREGEGQ